MPNSETADDEKLLAAITGGLQDAGKADVPRAFMVLFREIQTLQHDIARHVQIATDLTQENECLRAALRTISDHGELFTPDRVLMKKWHGDYSALQAIAREALGNE